MKTKTKEKKPAAPAAPTHEGKPILTEGRVLSTFGLGRDVGVVSISDYAGKRALDLRRYYLDDEHGEWRPTSKGIRIPAEQVTVVLNNLRANYDLIEDAMDEPPASKRKGGAAND